MPTDEADATAGDDPKEAIPDEPYAGFLLAKPDPMRKGLVPAVSRPGGGAVCGWLP